jgi:hypothetical protein
MRERIWSLLKEAGKPVPAHAILEKLLGLRSNSAAGHRILLGIVGDDPRFRSVDENWELSGCQVGCFTQEQTGKAVLVIQESAGSARIPAMRGAVLIPGELPLEFCVGLPSSDPEAVRTAWSVTEGRVLIAWDHPDLAAWKRWLRHSRLPESEILFFPLRPLAVALGYSRAQCHHPQDLSSSLGLGTPDPESPACMTRYLLEVLDSLLSRVPVSHRADLDSVRDWMRSSNPGIDFSRFSFGPDFLQTIPETAGVYIMRSRTGKMIYVGKSRNLKRRIRSYFAPRALKTAKIARIHHRLYSLDFVPAISELEALLLEMRLIRDFRPEINRQEEVHEKQAEYAREFNLIILVPDRDRVTIYFMRKGVFVGHRSVLTGKAPAARVRERIRKLYFDPSPRSRSREPWEGLIVGRWLAANRKRINFIDVDDAGDYPDVIQRLRDYLMDPERLRNKVHYR